MEQLHFDFSGGKKRQHRSTSKAAHESVKEHKQVFYDKIEEGLKKLVVGGTSEEVARAAGIEYAQCHKRIYEMIEAGTVFNTGITRKNSSGRKAMVRQLTKSIINE